MIKIELKEGHHRPCWVVSFVIFQGIRTSTAKNPCICVIFQGRGSGSLPPSPSGSAYGYGFYFCLCIKFV